MHNVPKSPSLPTRSDATTFEVTRKLLGRAAGYAFALVIAGAASGCSLVTDFDTPIPEEDSGVIVDAEADADVAIDTGVDTGVVDTGELDTGADTAADAEGDTEGDTGVVDTGALDTGADTGGDTGADTAEAAVDAAEDAADAADTADAAADTWKCTSPSECPGTDTDCVKRTCNLSGTCGFDFTADGVAVAAQTAGDCKRVVCNGAGGTRIAIDDTDRPNDAKQCTADVCTTGTPTNPPLGARASCSESGGTLCDGAGNCVACLLNTDCASGVCNTTTHTCATASCTDTVKNGTETDVDCGGSCATKCALAKDCGVDGDCASTHCSAGKCVECVVGTDCSSGVCDTTTKTCSTAACTDGVKNGTETDVDCGGSCPNDCAVGKDCAVDGDCLSTHCSALKCVECLTGADCPSSGVCDTTTKTCSAASCTDTVKNGTETDVDCGGSCPSDCALGKACSGDGDCISTHCNAGTTCVECTAHAHCLTSGVCNLTTFTCAAPTCSDTVKNGGETDVDCGGTCSTKCITGQSCLVSTDCVSLSCDVGTLKCLDASCTDTIKNGTETDTDCGGSCSTKCANGATCLSGADCVSGVCDPTAKTCTAPSCTDTVKNGTETDVDCGGSCPDCADGKACGTGADCVSGVCDATSKLCLAATCTDTVKNGTETDVDCGGSCTADCALGKGCLTGADCVTGVCSSSNLCASPTVMSTTPADAATNVSLPTTVSVTFSGAMNPSTLTAQTSAGTCSGTIQVSSDSFATCIGFSSATPTMSADGKTATLTPAPGLMLSTTYAVRVTTAAQDTAGNAIGSAYNSLTGFTTVAGSTGSFLPAGACGSPVIISAVYGGGGSSTSAYYKRDYIELHNRSGYAVNLAGMSIQYGSATNAGFSNKANLTGVIPAGGYFLIGGGSGTAGSDLPTTVDFDSGLNLSATGGKVALVNGTTQLATCDKAAMADLFGYGSTTTCFEGTVGAGLTSLTAASRNAGCTDSDDNAADFTAGTPTAPRNAATTPVEVCTCGTVNESDAAAEVDYCNVQWPGSLAVTASATTEAIYGRIYEAGLTPTAGEPTGVTAQVGYGPVGVNPTTQSGWQWFATTYNASFVDPNNDEYSGTFTAPATPGTYKYTYRFSLDGKTWTYCDLNGAGSNSSLTFEVSQLPTMTVNP